MTIPVGGKSYYGECHYTFSWLPRSHKQFHFYALKCYASLIGWKLHVNENQMRTVQRINIMNTRSQNEHLMEVITGGTENQCRSVGSVMFGCLKPGNSLWYCVPFYTGAFEQSWHVMLWDLYDLRRVWTAWEHVLPICSPPWIRTGAFEKEREMRAQTFIKLETSHSEDGARKHPALSRLVC